MPEKYEDVAVSREEGIAIVRIDRPDVQNAFRRQTLAELLDALEECWRDDRIYVVVLTGTNGFCAGADVTEMPDWSGQEKSGYAAFLEEVQGVIRSIREASKPAVAAVDGPAIGAGCDIALACDIRVVGDNALFRQGFVNVGLVPGDGGAWLLPRLIGESLAKEYIMTGRDIDSEEAVTVGLAAKRAESARTGAYELARELRDQPRLAMHYTKRLFNDELSFDEYCERAIHYQWECVNDEEHQEAVQAFLEKRQPSYGRTYE